MRVYRMSYVPFCRFVGSPYIEQEAMSMMRAGTLPSLEFPGMFYALESCSIPSKGRGLSLPRHREP
jgi:hypothetical protein